MSLKIEIKNSADAPKGGAVTFILTGSLDTNTAPELDREMTQCLAGPVSDLVFDLAGLRFVSSAGLRLFSVARKQMVARGGHASIMNMQPQVAEVFAIVEKLPGFKLFSNIEALDQYLDSRRRVRP